MQALTAKHSQVEEDLALFQKDDILAWLARKTGKTTSASVLISANQLSDLTRRNARNAFKRLQQIAPPPNPSPNDDPQTGAQQLVKDATDVKNLCKMDATWQPWF